MLCYSGVNYSQLFTFEDIGYLTCISAYCFLTRHIQGVKAVNGVLSSQLQLTIVLLVTTAARRKAKSVSSKPRFFIISARWISYILR